ncbi:MAG: hypothetical protein QXR48_02325 [Candidatus Woesearchaeota archaeon]
MENKKITKIGTNERARRVIRFLAYFMFFYFGWRLIALPFIFAGGKESLTEFYGGTLFFVINLVSSVVFIALGLIAAYYLTKFKKWALITLIVLISLHAINILITTYGMGRVKLPVVQVTVLIFLILGFRYIKNAE